MLMEPFNQGLTGVESAGRVTVATSCSQVFPPQNGGKLGQVLAAVMAARGRHLFYPPAKLAAQTANVCNGIESRRP